MKGSGGPQKSCDNSLAQKGSSSSRESAGGGVKAEALPVTGHSRMCACPVPSPAKPSPSLPCAPSGAPGLYTIYYILYAIYYIPYTIYHILYTIGRARARRAAALDRQIRTVRSCGKAELWLSFFFKVLQFDILAKFRLNSVEIPLILVKFW